LDWIGWSVFDNFFWTRQERDEEQFIQQQVKNLYKNKRQQQIYRYGVPMLKK